MQRGSITPSYALETYNWVAGAIIASPQDTAVLVATPALVKGVYVVHFSFHVSVPAGARVVYLVLRNVADDADIYLQMRHAESDADYEFIIDIPVDVDTGQKFAIRCGDDINGHAQGIIGYAKVVV